MAIWSSAHPTLVIFVLVRSIVYIIFPVFILFVLAALRPPPSSSSFSSSFSFSSSCSSRDLVVLVVRALLVPVPVLVVVLLILIIAPPAILRSLHCCRCMTNSMLIAGNDLRTMTNATRENIRNALISPFNALISPARTVPAPTHGRSRVFLQETS